jgi:hypothetical protein
VFGIEFTVLECAGYSLKVSVKYNILKKGRMDKPFGSK